MSIRKFHSRWTPSELLTRMGISTPRNMIKFYSFTTAEFHKFNAEQLMNIGLSSRDASEVYQALKTRQFKVELSTPKPFRTPPNPSKQLKMESESSKLSRASSNTFKNTEVERTSSKLPTEPKTPMNPSMKFEAPSNPAKKRKLSSPLKEIQNSSGEVASSLPKARRTQSDPLKPSEAPKQSLPSQQARKRGKPLSDPFLEHIMQQTKQRKTK